MAHTLDRLVAARDWRDDRRYFDMLIKELPNAEMLMADNVYAYYYKHMFKAVDTPEGPRGEWETNFPNLAPPWRVFFVSVENMQETVMSVRRASHIFDDNPGDDKKVRSAGVLFVAKDVMEDQVPGFVEELQDRKLAASRLELKKQGVKWVLYALPISLYDDGSHGEPIMVEVALIDEQGQSRWPFFSMLDKQVVDGVYHTFGAREAHEIVAGYTDFMITMLFPAYLAISFLHVRNVQVIEHMPPKQASRTRERKTGRPLIKYRTLQIEPIKKVLREEGRIESEGLGTALHICRGHFKDFRGGKGLFGKHKDIYWWHEQERGEASLGVVHKDYVAPLSLPDSQPESE